MNKGDRVDGEVWAIIERSEKKCVVQYKGTKAQAWNKKEYDQLAVRHTLLAIIQSPQTASAPCAKMANVRQRCARSQPGPPGARGAFRIFFRRSRLFTCTDEDEETRRLTGQERAPQKVRCR